jgi:hypothetical protein
LDQLVRGRARMVAGMVVIWLALGFSWACLAGSIVCLTVACYLIGKQKHQIEVLKKPHVVKQEFSGEHIPPEPEPPHHSEFYGFKR